MPMPLISLLFIILFNFNKNFSRVNTINSLDYTGSLERKNISVLLKYFFNLIGGALISKPIFIFNNNKIKLIISNYYYFSFNIF